ncbi:MAG: PIN domain-containing protein [Candidatus Tectomicrobia bacterium]|uniref:PIN domain-containing protein n=1 Tax=Tectimicrobiota bacterium TaxID=2528274 RepID=A0A932GR86_UNCTE|nr:PIN domain-containing protein [Candidatus Tectomicrobia bacterium]
MPPILLFVDTSAWYAILDRTDRNHPAAIRFARQVTAPFVTSTYVLDETVTLVKRHLGHAAATRFGQRLWNEEVVMERLHLDSAFAFDAHFEQYGHFVRFPST